MKRAGSYHLEASDDNIETKELYYPGFYLYVLLKCQRNSRALLGKYVSRFPPRRCSFFLFQALPETILVIFPSLLKLSSDFTEKFIMAQRILPVFITLSPSTMISSSFQVPEGGTLVRYWGGLEESEHGGRSKVSRTK